MKKRILIICSFLLLIIIAYSGYKFYCNQEESDLIVKKIDANKSKTTQVYAIQNVPMEHKNMIWCGTMNLAWNELRDNMVKEDIKLQGEKDLCEELNKKTFTKDSLSDKDYIAMVGYKKDNIVSKINKALENKFKDADEWKVKDELIHPEDILAYSFLSKNIEFKETFENIGEGLDFSGKKVKAFGILKAKGEKRLRLEKQIKVLSYEDNDNFIISLEGKEGEEELVLAKITPKATFKETLEYAVRNRNSISGEIENLIIPKIGFKAIKSYDEVKGKYLLNQNFENHYIGNMFQTTLFTLSQKGAILKSSAQLNVDTKSIEEEKELNLVFDKPFLIYMREKNKDKPYFALWVYNTEIMMDK